MAKRLTIEERCEIHAAKMQDQGHYTTANVLAAAAEEIRSLRFQLQTMTHTKNGLLEEFQDEL